MEAAGSWTSSAGKDTVPLLCWCLCCSAFQKTPSRGAGVTLLRFGNSGGCPFVINHWLLSGGRMGVSESCCSSDGRGTNTNAKSARYIHRNKKGFFYVESHFQLFMISLTLWGPLWACSVVTCLVVISYSHKLHFHFTSRHRHSLLLETGLSRLRLLRQSLTRCICTRLVHRVHLWVSDCLLQLRILF